MRNWTVDHIVIRGDPATQEPWAALDRILDTPIENSFGVPMRIELCAVDTGGNRTQDAYDYCRTRAHRGVFGVKGASTKHRPIVGRPSDQDVTKNGKTIKNGVKVWPVGTDTAKDRIFGTLAADEERETVDRRMHFSEDLEDEYYEQLCAEAYNPSKDRWDKLRKRNEALDLKVYNFACAYHPRLRLNTYQDADWTALELVVQPRVRDLFSQPVDAPQADSIDAGQAHPSPGESEPTATAVDVAEATIEQPTAQPQRPAADAWLPRRDNWLRR